MIAENYWQVNEILRRLLDAEPACRQEILKNAEVSDEIRAEVESLLESEADISDFMSLSMADFSKDILENSQNTQTNLGQKIVNYKIIGELGKGGMGAVYLVERADGKFEQKAALKMLRREFNVEQIRKYFQREGEIQAKLEHPNIARLLDVGTTDDGVPFIVLEYVNGLPIDIFCKQNGLDLNARLDLFRKVCSAVTFAHSNLIVHRDLKPSNILVDAEGNPKLLDFGISKILSDDVPELTRATVTKLGAMTPSYASPEQLQKKSVTTSTDIYSLGVILYEILSGNRPFGSKEENLHEIYQAVLETEPVRPSAVTNHLSSSSNEENHSQINTLNPKSLEGDLDNIVLKALRKEPERRYSSVENLAEDIHRYQRGLPVSARPNTFFYRTEKFIKRNRLSVITAGFLLLAVFGGLIATFWQSRIAAAERDKARLEAEKVKKINTYTTNILNFSNPHWLSSNPQRNRNATISDALDEALKNIDRDLANEPEIQAEILMSIGQTFMGQGQYAKSEKLLRKSIEKFNQVFGSKSVKSMQVLVILGDALYLQGNFNEAEKSYKDSIEFFRSVVKEDATQKKWLAIALNDLANIQMNRSEDDSAEKSYREAIELSKDFVGKERFVVPIALGNLGLIRNSRGFSDEALKYYEQASKEIKTISGEHSMEYGNLLSKIAIAYNEMGDYEQADRYFQESFDILIKSLGEENNYSVSAMNRISYNYYKQEKYEEAETLIKKSLEIQQKLFPKGHLLIANAQRILGGIYTKTKHLESGESLLRESLKFYTSTQKNPTRDIALVRMNLGENLIAQKRFAEAEENLNSALEISLNLVGENYYLTKECREILSRIPK